MNELELENSNNNVNDNDNNKLSFIERIKKYNNKTQNNSIEVNIEELDNEKIYLTPITVAEQHKITRLSPNGKDLEINILIEKARDKDGKKLLTLDDKEELRKLPLSLMNKILSPILADINKTNEELEKN